MAAHVEQITSPDGEIEIRFTVDSEAKPPIRMYELRGERRDPITQLGMGELTDWIEVPSVTTVLNVLDKPALVWWGQRVGVGAIKELMDLDPDFNPKSYKVDQIVDKIVKNKLSVNHVRNAAGDRGLAVHKAFENWGETGRMPDPTLYPASQRGYIRGLVKFLDDVVPEGVEQEVMVGSLRHGFAGRYDARIRVTRTREVVFKRTPKRGNHYADIRPGTLLLDLKTSAGVYPSHSRQLEAYELASQECGYEPSTHRAILRVDKDGYYELVPSRAEAKDFLAVLAVYESDLRMKERG